MHMNPVKRGLVADPKVWAWSPVRRAKPVDARGRTEIESGNRETNS
jgi:hypothetical protein